MSLRFIPRLPCILWKMLNSLRGHRQWHMSKEMESSDILHNPSLRLVFQSQPNDQDSDKNVKNMRNRKNSHRGDSVQCPPANTVALERWRFFKSLVNYYTQAFRALPLSLSCVGSRLRFTRGIFFNLLRYNIVLA
jgi:hypothetical protein